MTKHTLNKLVVTEKTDKYFTWDGYQPMCEKSYIYGDLTVTYSKFFKNGGSFLEYINVECKKCNYFTSLGGTKHTKAMKLYKNGKHNLLFDMCKKECD